MFSTATLLQNSRYLIIIQSKTIPTTQILVRPPQGTEDSIIHIVNNTAMLFEKTAGVHINKQQTCGPGYVISHKQHCPFNLTVTQPQCAISEPHNVLGSVIIFV